MSARLRMLAGLSLLALASAPAAAQEESRPRGAGATPVERWEQMSPEERGLLRQRYEEYMQLTEGHRRELRRRFERIRLLQETARARLPMEVRIQLEALEGAERRSLLQEYYEGELAERGRRVRELLPAAWRERLERAEADERGRLVAALSSERRLKGPERMLDEMGGKLDLPDAERERLRALPPEQRFNELVALRRKSFEERLERTGLPDWINQEQWAQLRELPPRAFLERLKELEDGTRGGRGRGGSHSGLLRPDPAWLVELAKAEPEERRRHVDERLRQRVVDHLSAQPDLATPEELQRLRNLQGRELHEGLRLLLRRARCNDCGAHESGRRPHGPPPPGPPPPPPHRGG